MRLTRVVIRNFRNFELLDIPLEAGVSCILGENNSGKSNFLHAIRLALDLQVPSTLRHLTENDTHGCVSLAQAQQVLIAVEFKGYDAKPEECALCGPWQINPDHARLTYRFRPKQSVREAIAQGTRAADALVTDDYAWELTGGASAADNNPATVGWDQPCGHAIRFQDLQAFKVDFLPALRDVETDLRHSRLSPLSRLLTVLDIPPEQKTALVQIIRDANEEIEANPTLHTAGGAVDTSFKDVAGEAFAMPVRLGMIAPTFYSITRNLTVLLSQGPVLDFDPSRNGLGLNNVLYVSMLLEYFRRRTNRPDTAGQLLLIEEPEAHLHPQLQHILFTKLRNGPFQTLVTTHSTHISSAAPLKSLIFMTRGGAAAAHASVVSAIPNLTPAECADLERYLDATRSTLLFARKVILVEGPAELFLIPALVKKVMSIDLERHGVSVVPIHGVHFAAYAKLFCAAGLAKKCAIITDGDLVPDDTAPVEDANVDEPPALQSDALKPFENDYLKVFACETTFERTLALPGLLELLEATCLELGAPKIVEAIQSAYVSWQLAEDDEQIAVAMKGIDTAALNTAKRFGKARFAQVASKHIGLADDLPQYIRDAVTWLTDDGAHP